MYTHKYAHTHIHGILQARVLEWVAIPFSRGSSWPSDWTQASCTAGRFFTIWATRQFPCMCVCVCMIKYTCIHWALLLPILHGLNTSTFSPHSTDSFSLWTLIPNYSLYWFVSPSPLICIHLQMCSSKNIALLSVPTLSSSSCWPTAFFFISFHLDGIRAIANWTPTVCQALVQSLNV